MRRYPSVKELARLTKPGRYAVGHGAFLQISQWQTRAWIFRYVRNGQPHHLGLGSCTYVTLAEARQGGFELRRLLAAGGDPLEQKRAAKREQLLATTRDRTFRETALAYVSEHERGWRGDKSRRQWLASLQQYAFPKIGDLAITDIDVAAVLAVLTPIWHEIPETARRVRHRIALILDYAAARELRSHDNPARRRKLLPAHKKSVKHYAALPYPDVPAFMAELRALREMPARALEFTILTGVRTNEALGARWDEVNGDTWTIPAERTKREREHRVPLSKQARALLASLPRLDEFVFPGTITNNGLNNRALRRVLSRLGRSVTVHGFRSAFRDWAAETTPHPNHVVEQALAHAIDNGVEAAYRRGDLFEKRRLLMQEWADFCARAT